MEISAWPRWPWSPQLRQWFKERQIQWRQRLKYEFAFVNKHERSLKRVWRWQKVSRDSESLANLRRSMMLRNQFSRSILGKFLARCHSASEIPRQRELLKHRQCSSSLLRADHNQVNVASYLFSSRVRRRKKTSGNDNLMNAVSFHVPKQNGEGRCYLWKTFLRSRATNKWDDWTARVTDGGRI